MGQRWRWHSGWKTGVEENRRGGGRHPVLTSRNHMSAGTTLYSFENPWASTDTSKPGWQGQPLRGPLCCSGRKSPWATSMKPVLWLQRAKEFPILGRKSSQFIFQWTIFCLHLRATDLNSPSAKVSGGKEFKAAVLQSWAKMSGTPTYNVLEAWVPLKNLRRKKNLSLCEQATPWQWALPQGRLQAILLCLQWPLAARAEGTSSSLDFPPSLTPSLALLPLSLGTRQSLHFGQFLLGSCAEQSCLLDLVLIMVWVWILPPLFFFFTFGCAGSLLLCSGFSSCGEWGLLFVAVHGLLTVMAPLVQHRL